MPAWLLHLTEQPEMFRWGQACLSSWESVLGYFFPRLLTPFCVSLNVSPSAANSIPMSCAGFWKMCWWVKIKERLHERTPRKELINEFNLHKTLKSTRLHILTAGKALVNSHTDKETPHTTHRAVGTRFHQCHTSSQICSLHTVPHRIYCHLAHVLC